MILLTNKEIKQAYGIKGGYGTMERVVKAQLKKIYEWGNEDCPNSVNHPRAKRECPACWQALLYGVK